MAQARSREWINQVTIKVDGQEVPHEVSDHLIEVLVDTALHVPAMFVIRLLDEQFEWLDGDLFKPGKSVKIEFGARGEATAAVIAGEITALEPNFTEDMTVILTIRGYDRSHRLNRGTKSKVFKQMKDSDIAKQVAQGAGLTAQTESTSQVHDHVFQHNQTDLAFLQDRAARNGFELFVDDTNLYFRKPKGERGNLTLKWGETLLNFHPRLTLAGQVDEVIVKGWNPFEKKEVVGKAQTSTSAPKIGVSGDGGDLAKSSFSAASQVVVRQSVATQSEADAIAQSVLDQINAAFVEAEGIAFGQPNLVAGNKVKIEGIGERFSGDYLVTSAVHVYTQDGYEVHFRVEGARSRQMSDLIAETSVDSKTDLWDGVVPAIVTNNNDNERKLGRIKVKFPWLDPTLESDWARIASIGGGNERGLYWMPEVNDEVLVAFEHGDFNRPYVIGSLWNGKDKPPEEISDIVSGGKVQMRTLKTREGHIIRLTDGPSDQFIEIIDAKEKNYIKLDTKSSKIQINTKGDMEIESKGKTTIKAGSTLDIEAAANLSIKGKANVNVEATGQLVLKGATVNIN